MKIDSLFRVIGSAMAVYGYYEILFQNVWTGVLISFIGNVISIPWFIRFRCWDVVVLLSIISTIELTRLVV